MLIVLGGLIGNGKVEIANHLASQKDLHFYDLSRKKLPSMYYDKRGNPTFVQPQTDAGWISVYEKVVADFNLLRKMHSNVILVDSFHRKAPRDFFFEQARSYFDKISFIWIETSDDAARRRLSRMWRSGIVYSVEDGTRRLERARAVAELPPASVPRFVSKIGDIDAQCVTLWEIVEKSLI